VLEELYAGSISDAEVRSERVSLVEIEKLALAQTPALNALEALAASDRVKILAEVKRASPSKGDLATISDPAQLAKIYDENGAAAISVLTEERRFKGSLADLEAVRKVTTVPVLRKDFLANEYQILEARAYGADIILLIVAGLEVAKISRLKNFAEQLGMTAFVETHSAEELAKAVDLDAKMIGVNARDLSTFETDRNLFSKLVDQIPAGVIKVAESAVRSADDVLHYRQAGADVVLVGEALVTNDPRAMLKSFLNVERT
jgi:indole-3-glycerol phosphate synthase